MAKYKYATTGGGVKEFEAADEASALAASSGFGDRASTSGIQRVMTAPTPVATDSTAARAETTALGEDIGNFETKLNEGLAGIENDLRETSKDAKKQIKDRRTQLSNRYAQEESLINQLFDQSSAELKQKQEKEFAGRSTQLITAGGYLGSTQSHEGVLANLSQTHKAEVSALTLKKLAAIQEARNAYEDRDYELADKYLKESKDLETNILSARKQFADQALAVQKEKTSEQNRIRDDARTALNTIITNFGGVGLENLSPESLSTIGDLADTAGIPRDLLEQGFRTMRERQMEATQDQREFQQMISMANLSIAQSNLALRNMSEDRASSITALDADRQNLPKFMIGMNEDQVAADLRSTTPPSWFKEAESIKSKQTITTQELQNRWNQFRTETSGGDDDWASALDNSAWEPVE